MESNMNRPNINAVVIDYMVSFHRSLASQPICVKFTAPHLIPLRKIFIINNNPFIGMALLHFHHGQFILNEMK